MRGIWWGCALVGRVGVRLKIGIARVVIQKNFPRSNGGVDVEMTNMGTRGKGTDSVPGIKLDHNEEDSVGDKKWRKLSR